MDTIRKGVTDVRDSLTRGGASLRAGLSGRGGGGRGSGGVSGSPADSVDRLSAWHRCTPAGR